MFPEISRRCLVCGASARAAAKFCPQCGGELTGPPGAVSEGDGEGADEAGRGGDAPTPPTREHEAFGGGGVSGPVTPTREHRAPPDAAAGGAVPPTREVSAYGPEAVGAEAARRDAPPTRDRVGSGAETRRMTPAAAGVAGGAQGEEEAGERRRVRAAARVREVKENLGPRVGKLREEALVVFDETPDDSGLRFVLIACGLFVVFLAFLLVSLYVLG